MPVSEGVDGPGSETPRCHRPAGCLLSWTCLPRRLSRGAACSARLIAHETCDRPEAPSADAEALLEEQEHDQKHDPQPVHRAPPLQCCGGELAPRRPAKSLGGGVGDVSSRAVARPMGWRPAFPLPCMTGSTPGQPQHAPSRAAAHDRIGAARGLPAMASRAGCADLIASGAYNRKSSARLSIPAAAPELPHSLGVNSEAEAEQEQEQRQKPMPHGACLLSLLE